MKSYMNLLIIFGCIYGNSLVNSIDRYLKNTSLVNISKDTIQLKELPTSSSQTKNVILPGESVLVLEGKCKKQIVENGFQGCYTLAQYGNQKGYVFDAALSRLPHPHSGCKNLEDYAQTNLGPVIKEKTWETRLNCGHVKPKAPVTTYEFEGGVRFYKEPDVIPRISVCESFYDELEIPDISLQEAYHISSQCVQQYNICPMPDWTLPYTHDKRGNLTGRFCTCSFFSEKTRKSAKMSFLCGL